MSSCVASCSTCCQKASAAFATSASWRTHAAPPSLPSSVLPLKRLSPPRPSSTLIIAGVTKSSPAIALISAPCAAAPWLRSVYVYARRHRRSPHHAAIPHDSRTLPFADHSRYRTVDAPRRNGNSHLRAPAAGLSSVVFCQKQQLVAGCATVRPFDHRHFARD